LNFKDPTNVDQAERKEEGEEVVERRIVSGADQGTFRPSDVYDTSQEQGYKHSRAATVPTARDSAYSGPPRYDWIDVESSAAIKIQSIFRRNQALQSLEDEGKSTAAMRNRIRARQMEGKNMSGEDVPTLFRFCGLGLLFGDATGQDDDALNAKNRGKAKIEAREKKERMKRKFHFRKKKSEHMEEAIEVVDDV